MKYRMLASAGLVGLLATGLVACGSAPTAATSGTPVAGTTAQATVVARPTVRAAQNGLGTGISGIGQVTAVQNADLTFLVQGSIADVKVKEGDTVKKDQLLATLDTRPFDDSVDQAQAALDVAKAQAQGAEASVAAAQAQQSSLADPPKPAAVAVARAQVQQAQIAVNQARTGQTQDARAASAGVATSQETLQATKDRLSQVKTQTELQMQQATGALTQAQAAYAQAKSNWEYVQSTGNDPVTPTVKDTSGKSHDNEVSDGSKDNYYRAFVQSEASMHQAEQAVESARVAYDAARQAEATGIQVSEQQVVQAQAALDKVQVPANEDRVAAARAALAVAQANLANLSPDARPSQKAAAEAAVQLAQANIASTQANVSAAEAALKRAQLNREYAELHAPYDGVVSVVNVDPGDLGTPGQTAIRVLDTSTLRVEVQISDTDIGHVAVGQKAQVFAEALPDQTLTGTVTYIAPEATTSGTARSYLVRVTMDQPGALRTGMTAEVNIQPK